LVALAEQTALALEPVAAASVGLREPIRPERRLPTAVCLPVASVGLPERVWAAGPTVLAVPVLIQPRASSSG
jgi:hypothetical protein